MYTTTTILWSHYSDTTLCRTVQPKILPFNFPAEVKGGQLIQVTCAVTEGDEPLTLSWYKDSQLLVSSRDFVINALTDKLSVLVLMNVGLVHTGTYSCVAANPVGRDEMSSTLKINGT